MAKTVLITGIAGMIGAVLSRYLHAKGYKVCGVDDYSGGFSENVPDSLKNHVFSIDIRETKKLDQVFKIYRPNYVIHLSAKAEEILSPFIRSALYSVNVVGSANVINASVNHDVEKFLFASCHDEKTKLVTKRGIVSYMDIRDDDIVFCLDKNQKLVETSFRKKFVYDYNGDMVKVSSRSLDFFVTPNHRVLYVKNYANPALKRLEYENASEFVGRAVTKIPGSKGWDGRKTPEITNLPILNKYINPLRINILDSILTKDLFFLYGLYIADGCLNVKKYKRKSGLSKTEFMNRPRDEKGRFLSQDVSTEDRYSESYGITFCVPENDKARPKLEEILYRNKIRFINYKSSGGYKYIQLQSEQLFLLFKECGKYAHEKRIPKELLNVEQKYLEELFDGLMKGDGNKSGRVYTTVSVELVRDLCELSLKIGRKPCYKAYPVGKRQLKDGKIIKGNFPTYYICIKKNSDCLLNKSDKGNFTKSRYIGEVWCLETEYGNFLVERNGKIGFSGNSIARYGDGSTPPFKETDPICEKEPYALSKTLIEKDLKEAYEHFGLKYSIVVPFNVFSPFQNFYSLYRNALAIFVRQSINKENLTVYGDGGCVRSFSSCEFLCDPVEKLLTQFDEEVFNIGSSQPISILEAAKTVQKVARKRGFNPEIQHLEARREVKVAYCDTSKAQRLLGLNDQTDLEKTIDEMFDVAIKQPRRELKKAHYEITKQIYSYWR